MKQRFFYLVLPLIALFAFGSCNSQVEMEDIVVDNEKSFSESATFKVSENEAKEILNAFVVNFDVNSSSATSTRGASKRLIKDVQALRVDKEEVKTYASDAGADMELYVNIDTMMYLINFENDEGFALVSADKRTTPVLAIIDKGSISVDALSRGDNLNPGFLIFLELAVNLQLNEIATSREKKSSEQNSPNMVGTRATTLIDIPARLKTRWGQSSPYNTYCPNLYPTGCVITATAQALSHFQTIGSVQWSYNGTYGSSVLTWNQIIADSENALGGYGRLNSSYFPTSSNQVAHLMRFLGIALNASYSSSGTGAKTSDAVKYLKNWCGLSSSSGVNSYNISNVRNGLLNSSTSLVITSAYATKKKILGITVGYTDGHSWILDGAKQIYYSSNDIKDYVHCNWGWSGTCDGFFISDGFDTSVNPPILGPNDLGGTRPENFKFVNENEYAILNY